MKKPFYHIVATDSRMAQGGRYIERLGFFNPMAKGGEERLRVNLERVGYWQSHGAQTTTRVADLLKKHREAPQAVEDTEAGAA